MEKQEIEKIKNQIAKAQKYLLSFSGHATKSYAIKPVSYTHLTLPTTPYV